MCKAGFVKFSSSVSMTLLRSYFHGIYLFILNQTGAFLTIQGIVPRSNSLSCLCYWEQMDLERLLFRAAGLYFLSWQVSNDRKSRI